MSLKKSKTRRECLWLNGKTDAKIKAISFHLKVDIWLRAASSGVQGPGSGLRLECGLCVLCSYKQDTELNLITS